MNNQTQLMDKEKFLKWLDGEEAACLWEGPEGLLKYDMLVEAINSGEFAPDTPPVPTIKPGDKARHPDLGEVVVQWVGDNIAEVAVGMAHYDVSLKDLEVVE